jgi:uroporphyrinogen decarboxylase
VSYNEAMTSRERVLAAFDHEEPDRVPAWCGASVEFWNKAKRELQLDDEGLRVTFGDDFRRYGQPMNHPLENATLEEVHDYAWPDPEWMDVSNIKAEAHAYEGRYAILGGDWSPFWHDAIDLLGMENLYIKMYCEPALVDAVMQHLVDYYTVVNERIFSAAAEAIDIFFIGNDFGSTTGPLLGPELFERFILPHLRRLIAAAVSAPLYRRSLKPGWMPSTRCSRRAAGWTFAY